MTRLLSTCLYLSLAINLFAVGPRLGWFDASQNGVAVSQYRDEGTPLTLVYTFSRNKNDLDDYLQRCLESGVDCIVEIDRSLTQPLKKRELELYLAKYNKYTCIKGWYIADEPDLTKRSPDDLALVYDQVKKLDNRDVFITLVSPSSLEKYAACADVFLIDKYPAKAGSMEFYGFRSKEFLGSFKKFQEEAKRLNKRFGFILQAFGVGEDGKAQYGKRLPTKAEMSWMLAQSVALGPEFVFFWARYKAKSSWQKEALLPVVRDFLKRQAVADTFGSLTAAGASGYWWKGGSSLDLLLANDGPQRIQVLLTPILTRIGKETSGRFEGIVEKETVSLEPYGVVLREIAATFGPDYRNFEDKMEQQQR